MDDVRKVDGLRVRVEERSNRVLSFEVPWNVLREKIEEVATGVVAEVLRLRGEDLSLEPRFTVKMSQVKEGSPPYSTNEWNANVRVKFDAVTPRGGNLREEVP